MLHGVRNRTGDGYRKSLTKLPINQNHYANAQFE